MTSATKDSLPTVTFQKKFPWAVLPYKRKVDTATFDAEKRVYEDSFRWARRARVRERCWPWRLGYELGWIIPSPVDITMTRILDAEVANSTEAELAEFARVTDYQELWQRESSAISIEKTGWLRLYDFKTSAGWESMFIPNGQSSVEWHLGWEVSIPDGYFLMILPVDSCQDLEVPMGILDSKTITRLNQHSGMSMAVCPQREVVIKRRQPIAKMILLHGDSLRVQGREIGE